MKKVKAITVNSGIYNIYFEDDSAIFNAENHEEYKDYIEQNKQKAIDLKEYLISLEIKEEEVEEIQTLEEGEY